MRHLLLVGAVSLLGCNAVLGLREGELDPNPGVGADASASDTSSVVDAAPETSACVHGNPTLNAEGCPCETIGAVRDCYLGDNGPKSACRKGGTQRCSDKKAWGACESATAPSTEVCYDDVDNDCDGKLDDGCRCGDEVDLCKDSGGTPWPGDQIVVDPPSPKLGSAFDIFILSKSPLANTTLQVNGGYCPGAAGTFACSSAGSGCPGWYALRQTLTASTAAFGGAGPATLDVFVDDTGAPCDGTYSRKIHADITIAP